MSFKALFSPRGVVVAGSVAPGKLGNIIIGRLIAGGMENLYAVNPKGQGLGDIPGFTSAQDIKEPVDLVVVVSPAFTVKDVLEDCGKAGIKAAIIISSGFSEAGHPELEEEVKEVALKYGIRYTGPNCAGLVNTHAKLFATLEAAPPRAKPPLFPNPGLLAALLCLGPRNRV